MSSTASRILPPDQTAREQALDASRSVLVQAPAGSGKTDLLTRRFLRLLNEVDDPAQIVAITFTKAAAAEMRHRILGELEKAEAHNAADSAPETEDEFAMETLAARALRRSRALGWNLIDLPAQLRITTIDAFCRELALQRPLLSGLGGGLEIFDNPRELYRRAARLALEQIDGAHDDLRASIESLLLWRDNGWQEMEDLLVTMLAQRDRWMHDFVLESEQDWEALREWLERPFARAVRERLHDLGGLLDQLPNARTEVLELARFACGQTGGALHRELAEMPEFPLGPFESGEDIEEARQAFCCMARLVLSGANFRQKVDKRHGFPPEAKAHKERLAGLIRDLEQVAGLQGALAAVEALPPARYPEEDWQIVRACFALLRNAAAQLKVVFAERGAADYTEIAQIALAVLRGEEGIPGEAAIAVADGIRHLLVDEFQDTSRRQHELLRRLIAAWPDRAGRTCFVVGDPMQSIYFFRDADAELFPRVRDNGLEIEGDQPLLFDAVRLKANFRTAPSLVASLNESFQAIFAADDGSGVTFALAEAARHSVSGGPFLAAIESRLQLHCAFTPASRKTANAQDRERIAAQREEVHIRQVEEIVALIRSRTTHMEQARAEGHKYRIAILGRARKHLAPIAQALRAAQIPFLAVELEELKQRPEVLDALALARALFNPHDRIAWLGALRAPWCGLSLADLHALVSGDDPRLLHRAIPELLGERAHMLSEQGRITVARVQQAVASAGALRAARPALTVGSWLEQAWKQLGGESCVDAAGQANLRLLWKCFDELPGGEQDLLGPALDAALGQLTALPDPDAEAECGVQLMTIHKAKGLEFEVVIVPELQATSGRAQFQMLAWLERGLAQPDNSGEVTEFLVAPLPSKGTESTGARKFVNDERRHREQQEMRRLLYVAATRAREELHLFARPEFVTDADGRRSLADPSNSLLATAWPALETEVCDRFERWDATTAPEREEGAIAAIAASEGGMLLTMPPVQKPVLVRRLPADFKPAAALPAVTAADAIEDPHPGYQRHEGGLHSRMLGIAVHLCLQELARLVAQSDWEAARTTVLSMVPRLTAQVRSAGIDRGQAAKIAAQAMEIALAASHDPAGNWILSPHLSAGSEVRWAGVSSSGVQQVQVDRIFRAGAAPLIPGENCWWIIDYKTAYAEGADPQQILPGLRTVFAPQLETYARVVRNLHGAAIPIRAGLYYPRIRQFDWWEI